MGKILIIGDLHMKESLRYSDYVKDGRREEVKKVLDTIVETSSDCERVVIGGDCFDVKNPPAQVIRAFTEFLERFEGKELFILAGNHEKSADGKSAIDYLREIKNPKWHICTTGVSKFDDIVCCPYQYRQEMKLDTYEEAQDRLLEQMLWPGKFLFVHHAISDSLTVTGQSTNLFSEIVLPKKQLEERYLRAVGFHIHKPQELGQTLIAGCVFTNEVGDEDKYVFKLNEETNVIEWIPLPCRPIIQLKDPTLGMIQTEEDTYAIVKCIFTEKSTPIEEFKMALKKFDAYIIVEQYPHERKKFVDFHDDNVEFDIPTLLRLYAKSKKIDEAKLLAAWEEIKL